jgi:dienelactone hydrolase
LVIALFPVALSAEEVAVLPATQSLTLQGDLSAQMVAGIDKFLMHEIERSIVERQKLWQRDFSSTEAYEQSVQPNRERFRKYIGAVDERVPINTLEYVSDTLNPAKVAEIDAFTVFAVRWPVFENVYGEGLLLQPKGATLARVIAIPDADQTPEMLVGLAPGIKTESQFARRLVENGCQVLLPTLINRDDTWSGNRKLNRFTNQPHREWIYRQAFEMGRHIIGYEVQKVLAAVDWFASETSALNSSLHTPHSALRIGVVGYAEGGLIAFYSAALDKRIEAALVSGYFDSRQRVWEEPIYRNVFGLLHEFGDAEIASLIAPRSLIVEHSTVPKVDGPPKPHDGRGGAAPGQLTTPDYESVEHEFNRAREILKNGKNLEKLELLTGTEGMTTGPGSDRAMTALLKRLGLKLDQVKPSGKTPKDLRMEFSPLERQQRQVKQLEDHTQRLLRESERVRADFFWSKTKGLSTNEWKTAGKEFKNIFWEEVIGKFPPASLPANPRSRKIRENPKWTAYEVVLDVWPDVYAWGYLLLPKDIKPSERRPVVVCQHGLEGVPEDTVSEDPKGGGYHYYKAFSARLAERGFVVFAPHNPYRGQDKFRVLQRKANPLKKSLFSVILAQHDRILDWLSEQPFVDPKRIGFYGLSYGGKTAMRVPSLLDRYCLSICSADFNEWIVKNVTVDSLYSYMFGGEYEMVEFNLGHTFNYAEMAALIAPRPFMVERGHNDGVAPDEWVAYEYTKVRRFYDQLGISDRTALEIFNGPHTINGVGTYEFLAKHLNWPAN